MIALTFDDGPDPRWTPQVLDALAAADARATFFPLSSRAAAQPALLARIRAEGHLVGLHGWAHLRHAAASPAELEVDTDRAIGALGEPPRWWRLPWGQPGPSTRAVADRRGLRIVGWTHDTHDWRGDPAADMLPRVMPGDADAVVLAHDALGPGARRDGCAETVALIAPLVEAARAAGHLPVRIDALGTVPEARP